MRSQVIKWMPEHRSANQLDLEWRGRSALSDVLSQPSLWDQVVAFCALSKRRTFVPQLIVDTLFARFLPHSGWMRAGKP